MESGRRTREAAPHDGDIDLTAHLAPRTIGRLWSCVEPVGRELHE